MRHRFVPAFILLFACVLAIEPSLAATAPTTEDGRRLTSSAEERRIQRIARTRVSPRTGSSSSAQRALVPNRVRSRPSTRAIRERAQSSSSARPRPTTIRRSSRPALDERDFAAEKERVLELVNDERRKADLPPLTRNDYLDRAAQDYAQDLFDRDFFDHIDPDGRTFGDRIKATGYPGHCHVPGCFARVNMGENLAKGYVDAQEVVDGWMGSPGHRANILSPLFEQIGLGIVGTIWVQEFGKFRFINP